MPSVYVTGGRLSTVGNVRNVAKVDTVGTISSINSVKDVRISALPCPKINDAGLTGAWRIMDVVGKAASSLATYRALESAKDQEKIGRKYYRLAKNQWGYFEQTYKPLEQQELDELHKETKYLPDYQTAIAGHDCADTIFDNMSTYRDKLNDQFCVCPNLDTASMFDLALSTIRGDSHNFAREYANNLADKKNDIRWNRKMQAASRGRNLLPQSSKFAQQAAGIYGQYSQTMTGFAQQAARFSGYISNRRNTVFNEGNRVEIANRLGDLATVQTGSANPYGFDTRTDYQQGYYSQGVNYGDGASGAMSSFYSDPYSGFAISNGIGGTDSVVYDGNSISPGFGAQAISGGL